ncbi:hypothetical protein TIFTF001_032045 [Ficus carica]|uniref:Uncharacterized protein n=1 Tax=Ficus carica TaxID=3494 RepID=A0AA88DWD9_FICCA|nr:hypothetical protein TIFTF001_032045 [Ficus carica]
MVRNSAQQICCYQLGDWAYRPGRSWACGLKVMQPTISHAGKESSPAGGWGRECHVAGAGSWRGKTPGEWRSDTWQCCCSTGEGETEGRK